MNQILLTLTALLLVCISAAAAGTTTMPAMADVGKAPPAERKVIAMVMGVARTMEVSGAWRTWQNNKHKPNERKADGLRAYGKRRVGARRETRPPPGS